MLLLFGIYGYFTCQIHDINNNKENILVKEVISLSSIEDVNQELFICDYFYTSIANNDKIAVNNR